MKPVFLVFCEGETEEAYINFLRQKYRLPLRVIPYITGLSISTNLIRKYIVQEQIGRYDSIAVFLMYDLDTRYIHDKLAVIREAINISSSPCIELWFFLHMNDYHAEISANNCITLLHKSSSDWVHYEKGSFSARQKQILWDNRLSASERARKLPETKNPSSAVYKLIERMESQVTK
jgi:hypothetical protein